MSVDLTDFDPEVQQGSHYTPCERVKLYDIFDCHEYLNLEGSKKLQKLSKKISAAWKSIGSEAEGYPKEYFDPKIMCLLADYLIEKRHITLCSIDCEFYEQSPGLITEIGISVVKLDKRNPLLLPPIRNYHLVRKDRFNQTRNSKYVPDHRGYSTTAVSVVLPLKKSRQYFRKILEHWINETNATNGIFLYVGHQVLQDLDALRESGYYVPAHFVLDTSILWSYPLQKYQVSLFDVMTEMGFQQRFLHNAVNDANITLQAAVNMIDPEFRERNGMWDFQGLLILQEALIKLDRDFKLFLRANSITHKLYQPKFSKSMGSEMGSVEYYQYNPEEDVENEKVEMFCFKLFRNIGTPKFQHQMYTLKELGLSI